MADDDDKPCGQAWTAFRAAEKKYALYREQKLRMKGGRLRAVALVTRPLDLSGVLDLHTACAGDTPPGVTRHAVPGCAGPVFTFEHHPGLVFLPAAVPPPQQRQLLRAALHDYPQPPARTNHNAHFGPITGLWEAAQAARAGAGAAEAGLEAVVGGAAARGGGGGGPLRLRWARRDGPAAGPPPCVGCEHVPAAPRTCGAAADQHQHRHREQEEQQQLPLQPAEQLPATATGRRSQGHGGHGQPALGPGRPGLGCTGAIGGAGCGSGSGRCSHDGSGRSSHGGSGRSSHDGSCGSSSSEALLEALKDGTGGARGMEGPGGGGAAEEAGSGGRSRGASAPSFAECWSAEGPGPTAEQLLRKLRWATLGPQFDWSRRQYDMAAEHRPLPASLAQLATQLVAAVEALQHAGLGVLPIGASGRAAAYQPDAAIVNYYQPGDALGGHLDDVERDLSQPIVSASLGADALFLMGGPSRAQAPTAMRLRGGDVLVLAGPARRCYHGVPRILEPEAAGTDGGEDLPQRSSGPEEAYFRTARVNISIRAVR
ncbi:Alpha-ketoglutarate-dependent dioxygenase alkB [Tetrabaena socialis]|uniref:Alpha-ketoglutarate-dependent dioxygenase alkB n=1 Tax=Tetrabaena socialis TaxID=47790 RepID=A0A2J8A199_9CHLO|nr:Alpha-ketoglutarate-dependent dioxygenase alkB [Tetrabaena socialis]|eukprot:PNH06299.1 Alpha-ketoglutarate-dependent dioxygenase alkB [Tetrabaena socialis]